MARSHRIDIGGLLTGGRQHILVEAEVPVEAFEGIAFPRGARVRLELRCADGMLVVDGDVDARARGECDRCLEEVERDICVDVAERLDPSHGRDDDPFGEANVLSGDRLDVADLAQQLVLSVVPMGLRCSDDCRGLCGKCGTNKNTGICSCDNGDRDGKSEMEDASQ